jgi:hypothetical protein
VPTSILALSAADAVVAKHVRQIVELARGIQQRLGGNAAHIEAGTAQRQLAISLAFGGVHAGHAEAELRGTNGGNIAPGTAADDNNVKLLWIAHRRHSLQSQQHAMRVFELVLDVD